MSERKHLTEENSILEGNEQLTKAELSAKIAASLAGRAAMTKLPKIALGAWAWGNDGTFGNNLTAENLKPIFDTAMENGLNLWDTAYAYGMGTSEKVLAGFLKAMGEAFCRPESLQPDQPLLRGLRHSRILQRKRHYLLCLYGIGTGCSFRKV